MDRGRWLKGPRTDHLASPGPSTHRSCAQRCAAVLYTTRSHTLPAPGPGVPWGENPGLGCSSRQGKGVFALTFGTRPLRTNTVLLALGSTLTMPNLVLQRFFWGMQIPKRIQTPGSGKHIHHEAYIYIYNNPSLFRNRFLVVGWKWRWDGWDAQLEMNACQGCLLLLGLLPLPYWCRG